MDTNDIDLDIPDTPLAPPHMTKVKIVSDGTPHGTYLVDLFTNKIIADIVSVDIILIPGEVPQAHIVLHAPVLDIRADASINHFVH